MGKSNEYKAGYKAALEQVLSEMYDEHDLSNAIHTIRKKLGKKEDED